ncbi:MAG: hypothetical protein LBE91_19635 [Tannerella sp.]|jgi:hypothetical protein|nr:hypothetical protein [Tannerella sp.]
MKQIVKLTIILSLFAQVCHAQNVETEEEYRAYNDSIISLLKTVRKDSNNYVGKPFSELVKLFDKCGVKITELIIGETDNHYLNRQLYSVRLKFNSEEINDLAWRYTLRTPTVHIYFRGSKPYYEAVSLFDKYKEEIGVTFTEGGPFTEEVEAFYSDAVIKSVIFPKMDGEIYNHRGNPKKWKRLPSSGEKPKVKKSDTVEIKNE